MLHRLPVLLLLILSVAAVSAMSQLSTAETKSGAHSPKIRELLKARRDVMAKRVEIFEAQFHNAQISRVPVLEARDELFVAELDLAENRDARIDLLKARVDNLTEYEGSYIALKHIARANDLDILQATSRKLLAEIELERALSAE
ncbi:hypothetical protein GC163_04410 [bacterium]|nr:hypothetical protein [bacterium]